MRAVLVAVLIHNPFQHLSASVVIKVGINIRQRDTVRVQETLKQKVVFHRVNLRDTETIGHHRACRRATSRSHHHAKFLARRVDEVLHDEEVAGETHRFHHVQLKVDTVFHLLS